MDQTQEELDHLREVKKISDQHIERQKEVIERYENKNSELQKEVDTLQIKLGIEHFELTKLRPKLSELERRQQELTSASELERQELNTEINDLEKQLKVHQKRADTYMEELRVTENQLIDSLLEQEAQSELLTELQDKLAKEKDRSSTFETGLLTTHQTYASLLEEQRAEQEQRAREGEEVLNQVLDENERQQVSARRSWWNRVSIRFSPMVTIKKDPEKVVQIQKHHFYPGIAHDHIVPETTITERHTSGKDKKGKSEVFIEK